MSTSIRSLGLFTVVSASLFVVACGGSGGGGGNSIGTNLGPSEGDAAISANADMARAGDAATPPSSADGAVAPTPATVPTGAWQVKTVSDQMAAGFQTVTINADGTYTQTGRTDGIGQTGQYSQPASIDIDSSFGSPPAGLAGPYISLSDDPLGDATWVYGWSEALDHSSLTLTLFAKTNGMGLRWADGSVINLVPAGSTALPASPAGTWQVASEADANTIGFQTLELDASGFVAESGRTDGQPQYMSWTAVAVPPVDTSSYGPAPAGMVGPYISLDNSQYSGDGNWVYGWSEAVDGSTLTITLYAQRNGMGLRWATPVTVTLVKGSTGAAPTGAWKTASTADTKAAGFSTITFWLDGNYTQTGRTDGESGQGKYTTPATFTLDPDFGSPPAGMTGPYVELSNAPTGDGIWTYGWVINADGSLTLDLYAQTKGMGLRWVSPATTLHLVKN